MNAFLTKEFVEAEILVRFKKLSTLSPKLFNVQVFLDPNDFENFNTSLTNMFLDALQCKYSSEALSGTTVERDGETFSRYVIPRPSFSDFTTGTVSHVYIYIFIVVEESDNFTGSFAFIDDKNQWIKFNEIDRFNVGQEMMPGNNDSDRNISLQGIVSAPCLFSGLIWGGSRTSYFVISQPTF